MLHNATDSTKLAALPEDCYAASLYGTKRDRVRMYRFPKVRYTNTVLQILPLSKTTGTAEQVPISPSNAATRLAVSSKYACAPKYSLEPKRRWDPDYGAVGCSGHYCRGPQSAHCADCMWKWSLSGSYTCQAPVRQYVMFTGKHQANPALAIHLDTVHRRRSGHFNSQSWVMCPDLVKHGV